MGKSKTVKSSTKVPFGTNVGDLKLQSNAKDFLRGKFDQIAFELDLSDTDKVCLIEITSAYARMLCARRAIYSWAQYEAHLQRAAKTCRKMIQLIGIQKCERAKSAVGRDIDSGAKLIIADQLADSTKTFEAVLALSEAVDRAAAISAERAKGRASGTKDFQNFLDDLTRLLRSKGIDRRQPQKAAANASKFDAARYPLFRLVALAESLAHEAVFFAISTIAMDELDINIIRGKLNKKTGGVLVVEIRNSLKRTRPRFR